MPILARHGLGILIIPQKPWHEVEQDFATYAVTSPRPTAEPHPNAPCSARREGPS